MLDVRGHAAGFLTSGGSWPVRHDLVPRQAPWSGCAGISPRQLWVAHADNDGPALAQRGVNQRSSDEVPVSSAGPDHAQMARFPSRSDYTFSEPLFDSSPRRPRAGPRPCVVSVEVTSPGRPPRKAAWFGPTQHNYLHSLPPRDSTERAQGAQGSQ